MTDQPINHHGLDFPVEPRDSVIGEASRLLGFALRHPGGGARSLERLPRSRAEAIQWVREENAGSGRYVYVRWIDDPIGGAIDFTEIAIDVYPGGGIGLAELSSSAGFTATIDDIEAYVRDKLDGVGESTLEAVLSSLGGNPDCDYEWKRVSLVLEKPDGIVLAEFMLEPGGHLELPKTSGSNAMALFGCQLPSVRSIVQFINVVLEVIRERHVLVRFIPLNQDFGNCFF